MFVLAVEIDCLEARFQAPSGNDVQLDCTLSQCRRAQEARPTSLVLLENTTRVPEICAFCMSIQRLADTCHFELSLQEYNQVSSNSMS